MNVSLPPDLERQIAERVASGRYASPGDVMREALHLLFRQDEERERGIALLNEHIDEGLTQLDRGEGVPGDEARRLVGERVAARRKASGST